MRKRAFWCAGLCFALGTAFAAVKQYKPGFNLFSTDQDIQLGKETACQGAAAV